jgi:hypothetical protein
MREEKNFKRSTDYTGVHGDRANSVHMNGKGKNITITPSSFNGNDVNLKSMTLLKQVRAIKSALPERKGIIKNF